MKVLFLCNLVPDKLGAFESFLVALGQRFGEHNDALYVVFAGEPIHEVSQCLSEAHVSWRTVSGWSEPHGETRPWRVVGTGLSIIRREKPDVVAVHFGNELPIILLIVLARLFVRKHIKWIWHQRQQIVDPSKVTRRLSQIRFASLVFDHFVVSYEGARKSLALRGIPEDQISVIYNAVNDYTPRRQRGWLRKDLKVPDDSILIANVGWLVRRKRILLSLQAFANASQPFGNPSHLLIVGQGPEEEVLRKTARELGVEDRIHFLGQRQDVQDILADSDILIHSSIAETCTNVVLESMSVGIPAVIMDAGAAREQIADGISGFVVPATDTAGLTERLRSLMINHEMRTSFGKEARKRWEEMFRLVVSTEKHHFLYQTLISGIGG